MTFTNTCSSSLSPRLLSLGKQFRLSSHDVVRLSFIRICNLFVLLRVPSLPHASSVVVVQVVSKRVVAAATAEIGSHFVAPDDDDDDKENDADLERPENSPL